MPKGGKYGHNLHIVYGTECIRWDINYVLIANSLKYNQLLAVAENISYKGPNYKVSGNTPNYLTTFCLLHRTSFTTEVGNAHTLKRVVGHLAARAKRSLSRAFPKKLQ